MISSCVLTLSFSIHGKTAISHAGDETSPLQKGMDVVRREDENTKIKRRESATERKTRERIWR
jgi:hypothetical protein